jgi:hypothetical protein
LTNLTEILSVNFCSWMFSDNIDIFYLTR